MLGEEMWHKMVTEKGTEIVITVDRSMPLLTVPLSWEDALKINMERAFFSAGTVQEITNKTVEILTEFNNFLAKWGKAPETVILGLSPYLGYCGWLCLQEESSKAWGKTIPFNVKGYPFPERFFISNHCDCRIVLDPSTVDRIIFLQDNQHALIYLAVDTQKEQKKEKIQKKKSRARQKLEKIVEERKEQSEW